MTYGIHSWNQKGFKISVPKFTQHGYQWGNQENTGEKVNYLDMTIWHDGTQWQSKLYDKKEELVIKGLKINKFPHIQSKITTRCKYGCITH